MSKPEHLRTLEELRCPETHQRLERMDRDGVDRLNAAIESDDLLDDTGEPIERPLQGALVRSDGDVAYPIRDNIPNLLLEDRIPLDDA